MVQLPVAGAGAVQNSDPGMISNEARNISQTHLHLDRKFAGGYAPLIAWRWHSASDIVSHPIAK
jgi:hypothetical protein